MENLKSIIFGLVFIIILVLFIRAIFKKAQLHFLLLKEIYPNKLNRVKSYLHFIAGSGLLKLDFSVILWYYLPFYLPRNINQNDKGEPNILKTKLIANNRIELLLFILMILWLFGIGYLLFNPKSV
jgi:hypothetical protein